MTDRKLSILSFFGRGLSFLDSTKLSCSENGSVQAGSILIVLLNVS
ncbi:MAG: hypothetical protein ACE5HS_00090 [bacterium]